MQEGIRIERVSINNIDNLEKLLLILDYKSIMPGNDFLYLKSTKNFNGKHHQCHCQDVCVVTDVAACCLQIICIWFINSS